MKQRTRIAIGLLVSLAFTIWAVRGVQWAEFWRSLQGADYLYLIPAALVIYVVSWVRAYRWRLLMEAADALPIARVFRWVNIGYLFNNILPAKAGEVVRGYLSGRAIEGGYGKAISALLIERLLDVLSVVVLLGILVLVVPVPEWITRGGVLFGSVALAGTVVLIVLSRFGERGVNWLWRWVGHVPLVGSEGMRRTLVNLLQGFSVLTAWRLLPGVLAGTALVWLGYALLNYVVFLSFGMLSLPFAAAALVLAASGVAMVLPSSPGAIGVFEKAGMTALALYAVGESQALSAMLVLHLFTNIVLILLGLAALGAEGLSWGGLRREALAAQPKAGLR